MNFRHALRFYAVGLITMLMAGCSASNETLVTQRYDVSDLMFVPTDYDIDPNIAKSTTRPSTLFDESATVRPTQPDRNARLSELRQYITENAEPGTWKDGGGRIADAAVDQQHASLSITQTPEAHQKVEALFSELRSTLTRQISVSTRILILDEATEKKLPDEIRHRLSLARGAGRYRRDIFLSPQNIKDLLKAIDDGINTNSLGPPRLTLFNGQSAVLVVQTQQAYVGNLTQVTDAPKDGKPQWHFDPEVKTTTATGVFLKVSACCTPDGKTAFVDLHVTLSRLLALLKEQLATAPPEIPAFIQRPVYLNLKLNAACAIPDGSTLVLTGNPDIDSGDPTFNAASPSRAASDAELKQLIEQENHKHTYVLVSPTVIVRSN